LLLYYITDRTQFPGDEAARRHLLLEKIAAAARAGVDYVQLREKDLLTRELELLAEDAARVVRENSSREARTLLLINSRNDVAMASCADGVHLRSDDISPAEVREIWSHTPPRQEKIVIAVSCHSAEDVAGAASNGADFAVFAPVFEKRDTLPTGIAALHEACRHNLPVLALGGVTLENAGACISAGAAGIAGIRLFQENDVGQVVHRLRCA
jgi:thiamine-phosphate pyrophosphorylase